MTASTSGARSASVTGTTSRKKPVVEDRLAWHDGAVVALDDLLQREQRFTVRLERLVLPASEGLGRDLGAPDQARSRCARRSAGWSAIRSSRTPSRFSRAAIETIARTSA